MDLENDRILRQAPALVASAIAHGWAKKPAFSMDGDTFMRRKNSLATMASYKRRLAARRAKSDHEA